MRARPQGFPEKTKQNKKATNLPDIRHTPHPRVISSALAYPYVPSSRADVMPEAMPLLLENSFRVGKVVGDPPCLRGFDPVSVELKGDREDRG